MADPDGVGGTGGGGGTRWTPEMIARIEKTLGLPPGGLAAHPEIAAQLGIDLSPDPNTAAIGDIFGALPPYLQQNGIQSPKDPYHWVDPTTRTVYVLETKDGKPTWKPLSAGDSADYLKSLGVDLSAGGAGGGSGGGGARSASDDPRYWDIQYQKLYQDALNMGLDSESARRQALATLITNRNNTALGVAQTSLSAAEAAAKFAANPRDAVAELMYRNQVGGATPFGDMTNDNFGEYGKALADKAASIFQPVGQDLNLAREYARSIPPVDFLNPAPAVQQIIGGGGGGGLPASPAAAPANPLAAMMERLNAMSDQEKNDFRRWTTADVKPQSEGGTLNFDNLFNSVNKPGESPIDTEGGLNINLNERAVLVTESGKPLAIFGERRPDGTIRREQIITKVLPSEKKKDKELEDANKAIVESKEQTLAAFAGGGTATVGAATPDDFMAQLSQQLSRLGGMGGGTGAYKTPLPSLRLLAGAPANALAEDPVLEDYTLAGYSALGIDPRTVASTIKKFTPNAPQNNSPRVSWV